ncbi:histidinol-phosphatase [Halalkalibacter wakoensis JCM 9140]|uniref:Histidinol-phosphatase n=1 Tax=Halalkalibacter wakoensis JCM 9140 TaxID=1236970 RepID=W4Q173_9BACI|nr:histidinol-phosphatase HisJ [Halalkalibacter wakoensis]GAE25831.1 histidinol-phosphatase [Halalkalibacter wakoensis JCM 9140]
MIHDGHIHSPFCPHGTNDSFEKYCEQAIASNIQGITFTEHAPLPRSFTDPTPLQDSGMKWEDLSRYISEVNALKRYYRNHLNIYVGLEVDYIAGFEKETIELLNEVGPQLDDSILSVHFLQLNDRYVCIDYSPEVFEEASIELGSVEAVYKRYYEAVLQSVQVDLGVYKPKRIGHMTLASKFQKKFPVKNDFYDETMTILTGIKKKGYELDYNGAGCIKPLCKEPYPPEQIIKKAIDLSIPLVYGSDAHQARALLSGIDQLSPLATVTKPQAIL